MAFYFIAVHAGAGFHSTSKVHAYRAAMQQALQAAATCLDTGGSSMDAVRSAVCVLEDAPVTNAGTGSNLTLAGGVECDASVMAGDGTQAAVGAVPGVTNPILAAHLLAVKSQQPLPCGLVPPTFLAGDAARKWALGQGLPAASTPEQAQQWCVTAEARSAWQQYCNILAQAQAAEAAPAPNSTQQQQQPQQPEHQSMPAMDASSPRAKRQRTASPSCQASAAAVPGGGESGPCQPPALPVRLGDICDTVGALVVDACGRVAAGVSSGGLALKTEGRVGEAAVIGAGAWAADGTWSCSSTAATPGLAASPAAGVQLEAAAGAAAGVSVRLLPGVAVSTSGVGERVMACALAKSAALQLQAEPHSMPTQAAAHVLRSHLLSQPGPWDAGLVAVRVDASSSSGNGHSAASQSSSEDSSTGAAAQEQGVAAEEQAGCGSQLQPPLPAVQPVAAVVGSAADKSPAAEQQANGAAAAVAASCQPTAPAVPLTVRVEFVAAFTSPSFAVGYLARDGRQSVLSDVAVLRGSQANASAGATAATPGTAAGGSASAAGPCPVKSDANAHRQPSVSSMEVSCSWPVQLLRP